MKVLLPLSSQPPSTGRAVERMPPNASDPDSGSVIAHAPILVSVSRSGTQRRFCSAEPSRRIAPAVKSMLVPSATASPGHAGVHPT